MRGDTRRGGGGHWCGTLEAPWEWPGLWGHGQRAAVVSLGSGIKMPEPRAFSPMKPGLGPMRVLVVLCGPSGQTLKPHKRSSGLDAGPWGAAWGGESSPKCLNRSGGGGGSTIWSYPTRLPRGATGTAGTSPVSPLSPPDGLAVESDSGRVPGPTWEEGLPCAGGGPGALRAPHLPLCGIHLPC